MERFLSARTGKTMVIVSDDVVWNYYGGVGGPCSVSPIVVDDYSAAYMGVKRAVEENSGRCEIGCDSGPLENNWATIVVIASENGFAGDLEQIIRQRIYEAATSPEGGMVAETKAATPNWHADREADADLCVQPPH
jgi:hypothetical protein